MTPTRASATTSSRASAAASSSGTTTSATPKARSPSGAPVTGSVSTTRAVEPRPNQVLAGLSRVHGASAESTSGIAKPRPTTAPATSLTGSAPGRSTGNRSRSSRSAPAWSTTLVRQSTRSRPRHRVTVCSNRRPSTVPVTTRRSPSGPVSRRTSAGCSAEPVTGPLGSRCQGPSPKSGCWGYSSYTRSSLPTRPGRINSRAWLRSWTELKQPPRAGSAVTR